MVDSLTGTSICPPRVHYRCPDSQNVKERCLQEFSGRVRLLWKADILRQEQATAVGVPEMCRTVSRELHEGGEAASSPWRPIVAVQMCLLQPTGTGDLY